MALKGFTPPTWAVNTIQLLADQVKEQATSLKADFDLASLNIKNFTTNLLTELQDVTLGNSGSNTVGHNSTSVTANNTGDGLEENRVLIDTNTINTGTNAGALTTHKSSGDHDGRYYTETELDAGQLDNRYFTEAEIAALTGSNLMGHTSANVVAEKVGLALEEIAVIAKGTTPTTNVFSVLDYGLAGLGLTGDATALNTLITNIGSTEATILFPSLMTSEAVYLIDVNVVFPENINVEFLNGATLKVSNGFSVTGTNTKLTAGLYKIFDLSLGGTIEGTWAIEKAYTQWFGTLGIIDESSLIQLTVDTFNTDSAIDFTGLNYTVSGVDLSGLDNVELLNPKFTLTALNAYGFKFTGDCDNVTFENATIVGNSILVNAQKGIFTQEGHTITNVKVLNSEFSGCMQNVDLGTHINPKVRGCTFKDTVGEGSGEGYGLTIGSDARDVEVIGNYFENCTRHSLYFGKTHNAVAIGNTFYRHKFGLGITAQAALDVSRSENVSIVGNTFTECTGRALAITSDSDADIIANNINVTGNVFKDTNGAEIQIGSTAASALINVESVKIHGNTFSPDAALDNPNIPMILVYSGKRVSIKNNTINADNSYTNLKYFVQLSSGGGDQWFENVDVSNNDGIITSAANGILVRVNNEICLGSAELNVFNNTVESSIVIDYQSTPTNANIATDMETEKAITLAVGSQTMNAAGYNHFRITGNGGGSTVTDFVNVNPNKEINLRFLDANTTITRVNAKLSGGVSFVSTNFDLLTLRNILTVWYEKHRSVNL